MEDEIFSAGDVPVQSGPPPVSAMQIVGNFFRNPVGGGGDLAAGEPSKVPAGFIMAALGFGAMLLGVLMVGIPMIGQIFTYLIEFYLFVCVFLLAFNFLGLQLGQSEKKPGDAILGFGAIAMFMGITSALSMIVVRVFATNLMMTYYTEKGIPSPFIMALIYGFSLWFLFILGSVSFGVFTHRYKVSAGVSAWFGGLVTAFSLAFGAWLFFIIVIQPMLDHFPFGGGGGMFRHPRYNF